MATARARAPLTPWVPRPWLPCRDSDPRLSRIRTNLAIFSEDPRKCAPACVWAIFGGARTIVGIVPGIGAVVEVVVVVAMVVVVVVVVVVTDAANAANTTALPFVASAEQVHMQLRAKSLQLAAISPSGCRIALHHVGSWLSGHALNGDRVGGRAGGEIVAAATEAPEFRDGAAVVGAFVVPTPAVEAAGPMLLSSCCFRTAFGVQRVGNAATPLYCPCGHRRHAVPRFWSWYLPTGHCTQCTEFPACWKRPAGQPIHLVWLRRGCTVPGQQDMQYARPAAENEPPLCHTNRPAGQLALGCPGALAARVTWAGAVAHGWWLPAEGCGRRCQMASWKGSAVVATGSGGDVLDVSPPVPSPPGHGNCVHPRARSSSLIAGGAPPPSLTSSSSPAMCALLTQSESNLEPGLLVKPYGQDVQRPDGIGPSAPGASQPYFPAGQAVHRSGFADRRLALAAAVGASFRKVPRGQGLRAEIAARRSRGTQSMAKRLRACVARSIACSIQRLQLLLPRLARACRASQLPSADV